MSLKWEPDPTGRITNSDVRSATRSTKKVTEKIGWQTPAPRTAKANLRWREGIEHWVEVADGIHAAVTGIGLYQIAKLPGKGVALSFEHGKTQTGILRGIRPDGQETSQDSTEYLRVRDAVAAAVLHHDKNVRQGKNRYKPTMRVKAAGRNYKTPAQIGTPTHLSRGSEPKRRPGGIIGPIKRAKMDEIRGRFKKE